MNRLARNKHSILFGAFVYYIRKSFITAFESAHYGLFLLAQIRAGRKGFHRTNALAYLSKSSVMKITYYMIDTWTDLNHAVKRDGNRSQNCEEIE
jgi:hypothetical protein